MKVLWHAPLTFKDIDNIEIFKIKPNTFWQAYPIFLKWVLSNKYKLFKTKITFNYLDTLYNTYRVAEK